MSSIVFQLKPNSLCSDTEISSHDYKYLNRYLECSPDSLNWWSFNKEDFDKDIEPIILTDIIALPNGDEKEKLRSFYCKLSTCRNRFPEDDSVDLLI